MKRFLLLGNDLVEIWQYPFDTQLDTLPTGTEVDGINSSQVGYPDYSMGIFTAVDNDNRIAVVGWDVILVTMGL